MAPTEDQIKIAQRLEDASALRGEKCECKEMPEEEIPMPSQTLNINIQCKNKLSPYAKSVLLSWREKKFYHANEDILSLFKSNIMEQDFLLKTLHSMAIYLQNATCISFFDISIGSVAFTPEKAGQNSSDSGFVESLTFKLRYPVIPPSEKTETPW